MSDYCKICNHPKRREIDRALVGGQSATKLSRMYDVPYNAVLNHKQNHLNRQMVTAYRQDEMKHVNDLKSQIDELVSNAKIIFERNFAQKRDGMALKALDSQRQTFELLVKISEHLLQAQQLEASQTQDEIAEQLKQEQQKEFSKKLDILSPEELQIYGQIMTKIMHQDANITIQTNEFLKTPQINARRPSKRMKRTKYTSKDRSAVTSKGNTVNDESTVDKDLQIDPDFDGSEQIPCYKWHENPDNPQVQLRRSRGRD